MRILVISDLPHFVTGGAEMQASRLIEAWLDAGHEVVCLGRRMRSGEVPVGGHKIVVRRIRTAAWLGRLGRAGSYFLSLAWLLLRYRRWADVVYTRFLGEAAVTASLLKAIGLLAKPVVATPANTGGAGDARYITSTPFTRLIVRLLDRHCEAINLIAPDMASEFQSIGFSGQNFSHIPNGITVSPPHERRTASPTILLAVGRLSMQKGYDILLAALAQVVGNADNKPWHVWIVGNGPERDRLHALATELSLTDRLTWWGELPVAEVAGKLESAHAFLLPSRYEGMSNAGLEAMERGLPLVISRCGGLDREIDERMGWVVPPGDIDALADAIASVLACDLAKLAEMGKEARRCVEAKFDMRLVGRQYLELFDRLSRRSNAPTA